MRNQFLAEIENIIQNEFNHSFGNDILYGISDDKKYPWGDKIRLADKIWLIGRSYTASPERRYIGDKIKGKDLLKLVEYRGDGTGDFFIELASIISNNYNDIVDSVRMLKRLQFDKSRQDLEILQKSIQLVLDFNALIRDAAIEFDDNFNSNLTGKVLHRQHVSFCSKFLHFHIPYSVFIFDHFTEEGSKSLINERQKNIWKLSGKIKITKTIKDIFVDDYSKYNKDIKIKSYTTNLHNYINRYKEHCIREYLLCCYVKSERDNLAQEPKYYPRMADSVCQRIQKSVDSID